MGKSKKRPPVKLIIGFIFSKPSQFITAKRILERKFGRVDKETEVLDFSCTKYYEEEFGKNLKRKFLSFKNLISLKQSFKLKLYTNRIEKGLSREGKRSINIDPGYISLTKLVLFTTKNRSHRIYLDRGIYADLELCFAKKSFQALMWTYPDYRTPAYIDFFNSVRELYVTQVQKYL